MFRVRYFNIGKNQKQNPEHNWIPGFINERLPCNNLCVNPNFNKVNTTFASRVKSCGSDVLEQQYYPYR